MQKVNPESALVGSHFQTQIDFLGSKMSEAIRKAFDLATDPECLNHEMAPLHTTLKLPSGRFTRNLGDVSVVFSCQLTEVILANETSRECLVYPKIQTMDGRVAYIDAENRVLMKTSTTQNCSPATAPVMRAKNGKYFALTPDPVEVQPDMIDNMPVEEDEASHGLYTLDVVHNWLSTAWLQHFHKSIGSLAQSTGVTQSFNTMMDKIQGVYSQIKEVNIPDSLFGLNLDHVGSMCGLAAAAAVALMLAYGMVDLMLRILTLRNPNKSFQKILREAIFGHVVVLSERHNGQVKAENQV